MHRCPRIAFALLLGLGWPASAEAHPSGLRAGDAWWQAWHFDPLVVGNVLGLLLIYVWGVVRLRRRSQTQRAVGGWRVAAFVGGLLAVALSLLSPLDTLSEDLSWVHMTQHMVLMVVAAPLFILGSPGLAVLWALPRRWRRSTARWLQRGSTGRTLQRIGWQPAVAWGLHAVVLWGWHLPVLYEWALVDPLVHDVEHVCFFLAACLFWRVAIDRRKRERLNPGLAVLYLFTTSLHATLLGVFMTMSPRPWYAVYVGRTELWGLTALEDQQLAGLIMWMPACTAYTLVAAGVFAGWLADLDRSEARSQHVSHAAWERG